MGRYPGTHLSSIVMRLFIGQQCLVGFMVPVGSCGVRNHSQEVEPEWGCMQYFIGT